MRSKSLMPIIYCLYQEKESVELPVRNAMAVDSSGGKKTGDSITSKSSIFLRVRLGSAKSS